MHSKRSKLGLWMLIALVTGNMVGSGAFLLPANLARVGSISLLSLLATIGGALALAIVFAQMSLFIPRGGGPYVYAKAAFGEYMGLQTAYFYWVGVWVGNAALAVAALGYLDAIYPILHSTPIKLVAILLIIWVPTFINIFNITLAGSVQIITTLLKFSPLLVIGLGGWFYFQPSYLAKGFNLSGQTNSVAFSTALTLTLWLFIGVESATVPVEAVHKPQRYIPLATMLGTIAAAIIYLLSNIAIFGMIPTHLLANSTAPFALAMEAILGPWGKGFVALGAICACLGALNGWILVAAQIPLAASKEGFFPPAFSRCNVQGTPVIGLVITSTCITLLVLASTCLDLISQFEILVLAATTAEVLAYFYTAIALLIISPRHSSSKITNYWHLPLAIVAACYAFYAILSSSKDILYLLTAFILLTIPLYAIFKSKRRVSSKNSGTHPSPAVNNFI